MTPRQLMYFTNRSVGHILERAILTLVCWLVIIHVADAADPPRLKRADSFLGIHFDFHAGEDCKEVGKNTTPEMVEKIIDLVQPDYLQTDCKGHPGVSSYPTQVGHPVPGFVGDPLRVWRDVTARRGVALYMHYSGVWDSHAVATHPEWAVVNADGKPSDRITSLFGPYVDQLLIPQLRELAGKYRIDGVWVDGECWAATPDYSQAAVKAFCEATGIQDVPKKPGDPHWYEFLQFHRQAFRSYLNHYIAEVKRTNPEFQICSNWSFSDHMPEPVCAPVDFLSGDYSPQDSVNSARVSARFLARQGKPWDLMAWSFTTQPERRQKTAVQLQREAAVVLALGGGFQAYFTQNRDGSVRLEEMPVMAEVAKFCRVRQATCHHAEMVPQVALLFSTAAHYRRVNGLFSRDHGRIDGVLRAVLEGQNSVEIQTEGQLAGRLAEYPLIIVPEWEYLDPDFKQALTTYVQNGGNLLLIAPDSAKLFAEELGVQLDGGPSAPGPLYLAGPQGIATWNGARQPVTLGPEAKPIGRLHDSNDVNSVSQPAASVRQLGRGRIAAVYFTFGRSYCESPLPEAREFLNGLVRELFPEPLVSVTGATGVDVCVARKDGRLLVNLINTSGPHQTQSYIESIPPVGPLTIRIQRSAAPQRVTLEPGGRALPFEYQDGFVQLVVPQVPIHEIVVVE